MPKFNFRDWWICFAIIGLIGNVSVSLAHNATRTTPTASKASAAELERAQSAAPTRSIAPGNSAAPAVKGAWGLNDIVSLTQILSNVCVLIALALTLRQLSSTIRLASTSAVQSNAHALNAFYVALATSDDLARIYREGRQNPSALNPTEAARFFYACVAWFAHHEQAFGQVQSGLLPKEFFQSWELALRDDLGDLGFQEFWRGERAFFDAPFRDLIDRIIADITAGLVAPVGPAPAATATLPQTP